MELRNLAKYDLEDYSFWLEPHHAYHNLAGPGIEKMTTLEIEEHVQKLKNAFEVGVDNPLPQKKMIVDSTDQLIGEVSWKWNSDKTQVVEVGIVIFDEGNWGRGIGTFILKSWITELFEENQTVLRLEGKTWSGNYGMMRLAAKLGMKEIARVQKVNDEHYDAVSFGISKEEWSILQGDD